MKCNSKAFTIIELLVVAGINFILASLLLSSLSISKEQGRRIVCLNNLKNLQLAWLVYTNDNEGKVVDNHYSYPITYNWVHGNFGYNVEDNTNTFLLVGYENSMLGSYTKDYKIYKCPSDRSISTHSGKKYNRVRSYSLNSWIGGENSTNYHDGTMNNYIKALGKENIPFNFKVYKKDSDFNNPSYIFSFLDELPDSIDDGQFLVDLTGRALDYKNAYIIYNFVGFSHNKKGALAFVDGHVENKKWQEIWTINPGRYGNTGKLIRPIGIPGSKDVEWLMSHAAEKDE